MLGVVSACLECKRTKGQPSGPARGASRAMLHPDVVVRSWIQSRTCSLAGTGHSGLEAGGLKGSIYKRLHQNLQSREGLQVQGGPLARIAWGAMGMPQ